MNGKVHTLAGVVAAEGAIITFHQPAFSVVTFLALLGGFILGVAADLDDSDATLAQQQPFRFFSLIFERLPFVHHRGITHSFLAVALLYLLFDTILGLPDALMWAFMAAYVSHILLDMLTADGVELFWPFRFRLKLLPSIIAVSSDERSIVQMLFRVLLSVVFYLFTIHLLINALGFLPVIGPYINELWNGTILSFLPQDIKTWMVY
ncbi:metal-dependent hydrolase [Paenibacillus sp. LHD-117]|uniref:metal-dependent hydrolase n=1 Tax=Paenibacillus sp. LHD-117 TaxID=3071412 RepID=UPI0027E0528E|nr:metal-dependent hydrolase [Paenibacillus sp. LHD-117]MDQ6422657.1 metal-dependent hydrolase [Paenibacillus sp. LHD-117]